MPARVLRHGHGVVKPATYASESPNAREGVKTVLFALSVGLADWSESPNAREGVKTDHVAVTVHLCAHRQNHRMPARVLRPISAMTVLGVSFFVSESPNAREGVKT